MSIGVKRDNTEDADSSETVDLNLKSCPVTPTFLAALEKDKFSMDTTASEDGNEQGDRTNFDHLKLHGRGCTDSGTCGILNTLKNMMGGATAPGGTGASSIFPQEMMQILQQSMTQVASDSSPDQAINEIAQGMGAKDEIRPVDKIDVLIADLENIKEEGKMSSRHRLQKMMLTELTESQATEYAALNTQS